MGIFSRLSIKSRPKKRELKIVRRVDPDCESPASVFAFDWCAAGEKEHIRSLPLNGAELKESNTAPEVKRQYGVLYDLYCDNRLQVDQGTFRLRLDEIQRLDDEIREILGLEPTPGWKLTLDVTRTIGKGVNSIQLRWTTPEGIYNPDADQFVRVSCGFYDRGSKKLHILPSKMLAIRDIYDRLHQGIAHTADEYRMLAELQDAYEKLDEGADEQYHIERNRQLEAEDYIAPAHVQVDVEATEDGLQLRPVLEGIDDQDLSEELLNSREHVRHFDREIVRDGRPKKQRIALSPEIRREVTRIVRKRHVPREDVAQFVRNPRHYILPPEEQAAERAERARELGVSEDEIFEEEELEEVIDLTSLTERIAELNLSEYGPRVIGFAPAAPIARPLMAHGGLGLDDDYFGAPGETGESPEDAPPADDDTPTQLRSDSSDPGTATSHALRGILLTADNDEALTFQTTQVNELRRQFADYGAPELLQCELYDHQEIGYAWLRGLYDAALTAENGVGGLLADDMGLGKTVQIIALFADLKAKNRLGPSLLVVPLAVLENWKNELQKFCPSIRDVYVHAGSHRQRDDELLRRQEVIITTYDTLRLDQVILGKIAFQVMVTDEAQRIKNYNTGRASACRAMNAKLRIALTATPVENSLEELWSILDFCQPGHLGSQFEFRRRFVTPINADDPHQQRQATLSLQQKLHTYYLRRTKEDTLADILPEKHIDLQVLELTSYQQELYEAVRRGYKANPGRGRVLETIQALLRLSAHPLALTAQQAQAAGVEHNLYLTIAPDAVRATIEQSAKTAFLFEQLRQIQTRGEKVIIFAGYRRLQLLLRTLVEATFQLYPKIINGDVAAEKRHEHIEEFNRGQGFDVIIMSTGAAGIGVNVTGANHVIHLTREWNPAREEQATDRAYRIGQRRDVYVHIPIATGTHFRTLDAHLDDLLAKKRALASQVIRPSKSLGVTEAELEACLLN